MEEQAPGPRSVTFVVPGSTSSCASSDACQRISVSKEDVQRELEQVKHLMAIAVGEAEERVLQSDADKMRENMELQERLRASERQILTLSAEKRDLEDKLENAERQVVLLTDQLCDAEQAIGSQRELNEEAIRRVHTAETLVGVVRKEAHEQTKLKERKISALKEEIQILLKAKATGHKRCGFLEATVMRAQIDQEYPQGSLQETRQRADVLEQQVNQLRTTGTELETKNKMLMKELRHSRKLVSDKVLGERINGASEKSSDGEAHDLAMETVARKLKARVLELEEKLKEGQLAYVSVQRRLESHQLAEEERRAMEAHTKAERMKRSSTQKDQKFQREYLQRIMKMRWKTRHCEKMDETEQFPGVFEGLMAQSSSESSLTRVSSSESLNVVTSGSETSS